MPFVTIVLKKKNSQSDDKERVCTPKDPTKVKQVANLTKHIVFKNTRSWLSTPILGAGDGRPIDVSSSHDRFHLTGGRGDDARSAHQVPLSIGGPR